MSGSIRFDSDNRLRACIQGTNGFPAVGIIRRKLPGVNVRHEPAEMLENVQENGDRLAACIAGTDAAKHIAKTFEVKQQSLPPSGYRIRHVKTKKGNCLLVVGGDLFGMLSGLSEALLWSEATGRSLVYRGGDRLEKPAFPLRYYWTWDHSTNWVHDPGNQWEGCVNPYLKKPETFIEDYRRLVDHCVDMRFNAILIWGFLRDAHGGEKYSYEVARYAADHGVAILPGVGTTGYGGVYYEGDHPCNIETYLAAHPERGNIRKPGDKPSRRESSPYYPENREWMNECLKWLYGKFPIGGCNMENNDFMVDHSALAARERKKIRSGEADYFKDQYFAYKSALDTVHKLAPEAWNTYATYSGFKPGNDPATGDMRNAPYYSKRMPPSAIAQWTITGMVSWPAVPLNVWLETGKPKIVYKNPRWPRGLTPPTPRSSGFLHQASQWCGSRRDLAVSCFAESCLRSFEAGLEGISVHGEISDQTLAWNLNYLAMRHWTYHPVSSLMDFADAELTPRLGGRDEAVHYVRSLCKLEESKDDSNAWWTLVVKNATPHMPRNCPARGDIEKVNMYLWKEGLG